VFAEVGSTHPFWLSPAATRPPNGESFVELMDRARKAIDRLCQVHSGRDLVVVAHGGTIRAAIALALDLHPEAALRVQIDNLSVSRLDHLVLDSGPPVWRVVGLNLPPRG
jgi:alpha-ribazole phosphatase